MPINFKKFYYLAFALLDTVALLVQIYYSRNVLVYLFSYFTMLSNLAAIVMFYYLAFVDEKRLAKGNFDNIRGAIVLYMSITGIVYWTLLRHNPNLAASEWINMVAHGIMPIAVFASWLLFPPQIKLKIKQAFIWLIFPILYIFYTLIRGSLVHWYPYFFLNPNKVGYNGVIVYTIIITIGAWFLSLILICFGNLLRKKKRG